MSISADVMQTIESLFVNLAADGPNAGEWAVKTNVQSVAERLGHAAPTDTRVSHIEVTCKPLQGEPQLHSYEIGPGKYASAIWAEACTDPNREARSGELRMLGLSHGEESAAKLLETLHTFMGAEVMRSAASSEWSAKDHVVSAILQAPEGAEITLQARFK
uniref:Uncharacterized protein n=1 Tax=Magnetococcus massalia (strain MO-1) TaxID=451514 RepID=A0A1S7LKZ2_MAGMO|nr:protein of unknown function [Candidatus Magnetococcus massalia]